MTIPKSKEGVRFSPERVENKPLVAWLGCLPYMLTAGHTTTSIADITFKYLTHFLRHSTAEGSRERTLPPLAGLLGAKNPTLKVFVKLMKI